MKTIIRRGARVAALALAAGVAIGAQATTTVLAMDSLPTAQGWTYSECWWGCHVPAVEDAWSVDGVSLSLNEYAGSQGASVTGFGLPGVIDSTQPFTIDARIKVVSGSGAFTFYLGASTATQSVFVGLSTSSLQVASTAGTLNFDLDGTAFHDYQIAASPGSMITVKVDGNTVFAGSDAWLNIDPHTIPNSIEFGDGSSGVYGTAVMTSYSFTQTAAPVPEAGTLPLMALGLAGGLLWRRRGSGRH